MFGESVVQSCLAVCETLSFSRAAASLGISRQAVSKNIAAAEKELGVRLFSRNRQNVSMTAAGQLAQEFFIEYLARYRTLSAQLEALQSRQGVIRLGFQDHLSMDSALMRILRADEVGFGARVEIEIEHCSPSVLLNNLRDGRLDVVIQCMRLLQHDEPFCMRKIMDMPLVLMVSTFYAKTQTAGSWRDFAGEPLIVDRFEGESRQEYDRRVDGLVASCGLRPSKIIEVANRDSAFMAVKMKRGILIGADSSRYASAYNIRAYPLGVTDTLVCLNRRNDPDPAADEYAVWLSESHGGA